jgi:hypothetical protein
LRLTARPRGGLEQDVPRSPQCFEFLADEPRGRGDGAGFGGVGEFAQAVADEAYGVRRIERLVERFFHVEAEARELRRRGIGRAHGLTRTLASRRHGVTPANPILTTVC